MMGDLVLSVFTSLDGYVEPASGFEGPEWSDELAKHWSGYALARAKHLVYGRVNYEFNRGFWASAETDPNSPAAGVPQAAVMNRLPKTMFSRAFTGDPGWNGTVSDDVPGTVARLKQDVDGDIFAFGGANLSSSLIAADVVDEILIMILPVLWGGGKRMFADGHPPRKLRLVDNRPLATGALILRYRKQALS